MVAPLPTAATNATISAPVALTTSKPVRPNPRVTLTSVTPNNVGTLRKLNEATLAVPYSDKYYNEVLAEPEAFSKLLYYADVPIGSLTSRFEPPLSTPPTPSTPHKLHILTLNVLPAYRSQGLGATLVSGVVDAAREFTGLEPEPVKKDAKDGKDKDAAKPKKKEERECAAVFVYCQVGNDQAKKFYERLGFEEVRVVENYYHNIEPKDAVLLEKKLR